jgi:hypothetical protein
MQEALSDPAGHHRKIELARLQRIGASTADVEARAKPLISWAEELVATKGNRLYKVEVEPPHVGPRRVTGCHIGWSITPFAGEDPETVTQLIAIIPVGDMSKLFPDDPHARDNLTVSTVLSSSKPNEYLVVSRTWGAYGFSDKANKGESASFITSDPRQLLDQIAQHVEAGMDRIQNAASNPPSPRTNGDGPWLHRLCNMVGVGRAKDKSAS